jgi:hypothetical protein
MNYDTVLRLALISALFSSCEKKESPVQSFETGGISGKVTLSSGVAAVGANVYTLPPSQSKTTDTAGTYILENLTPGTYTVVAVRHDSTGNRQVLVLGGRVTTCDIPLTTTGNTLSDSSLVLFLPFNGNANDMSGHGNHATVHGATLTSDRFGNTLAAYNFNGVNNYMEIAYNASLHVSSNFTLCAWVFPTGFYSGRCQGNSILTKGLTGDEPGFYSLAYDENDFDPFSCDSFEPDKERMGFATNYGGQTRSGIQDSVSVCIGQWYFVAGTYDGMTMRLFINGTLKRSLAVSDTLRLNSRSIWIGGTENPSYPYWVNGKIDDIRIFRRALSDVEIQVLYTRQ